MARRKVEGRSDDIKTQKVPSVMGIIRCAPDYAKPSDQGTNVYLRVEKGLDEALARVEQLGGKILVPKMDAGDFGQFAWILDSEGNRVGLNQPKQ